MGLTEVSGDFSLELDYRLQVTNNNAHIPSTFGFINPIHGIFTIGNLEQQNIALGRKQKFITF